MFGVVVVAAVAAVDVVGCGSFCRCKCCSWCCSRNINQKTEKESGARSRKCPSEKAGVAIVIPIRRRGRIAQNQ